MEILHATITFKHKNYSEMTVLHTFPEYVVLCYLHYFLQTLTLFIRVWNDWEVSYSSGQMIILNSVPHMSLGQHVLCWVLLGRYHSNQSILALNKFDKIVIFIFPVIKIKNMQFLVILYLNNWTEGQECSSVASASQAWGPEFNYWYPKKEKKGKKTTKKTVRNWGKWSKG